MCFQVISMLSRRLKGKWSLRRRQGFHSTPSVLFTLRRHSAPLSLWYNLHSYLLVPMGEKKGSQSLHFWRLMPKGERVLAQSKRTAPPKINAKGGESISPKQKDRTTTNFKKIQK
jgi:hypothetical protein